MLLGGFVVVVVVVVVVVFLFSFFWWGGGRVLNFFLFLSAMPLGVIKNIILINVLYHVIFIAVCLRAIEFALGLFTVAADAAIHILRGQKQVLYLDSNQRY